MNPQIDLKMTTLSGLYFNPAELTPENVRIEDIAEGLSKCCRFAGQCSGFYSVAEHSVFLSRQITGRDFRKIGLLHDATEAYLGDLVRCVKRQCPEYKKLESRVWSVIRERFSLRCGDELPSDVLEADMRMLVTERLQLISEKSQVWSVQQTHEPYPINLPRLEWRQSRTLFLQTFDSLFNERTEND